ncbi:MAG: LamG domain-containing protein, partial [Patescibacteria group bacterium]
RYHYNRGGPVAQWKFDEGSGLTAYDASGNANTGTLQNNMATTSWTTGKYGSALNFDGVDDYADVGGNTFFDLASGPLTLEAWIKPNAVAVAAIFSKNCGGAAPRWVFNLTANNRLRFYSGNLIPDESFSTGVVSIGVWTHAVMIWDGSTSAFYFNGVLDVKSAKTGTMSTCNNPLSIGAGVYPSPTIWIPFNGLIDDVQIYNYARSPLEILQDYNGGFGARLK